MSGGMGSDLLDSVTQRLVMGLGESADRMAQSFVQLYRTTGGLLRDGAHAIEQRGDAQLLWWSVSPGGPGRRPDGPPTATYRPSAVEAAMAARRLTRDCAFDAEMTERVREATSTAIRKMGSTDGGTNIYKPEAGENYDGIFSFRPYRGAQTDREVAAYRLDEALGFGRIPPTARTRGIDWPTPEESGPGMIQQFVESTPARHTTAYHELQQQQVAVLDYIMGNLDRRPVNYRTVEHGDGRVDLVAIDHGRAFPESFDPLDVPMQSDFLAARVGKGLNPEIVAALDRVDLDRLRAGLLDAGLSENATAGALYRFECLRDLGRIPRYIAHE